MRNSSYDPLKDDMRLQSLIALKKLLDGGYKACNYCEHYLDNRLECWKKIFEKYGYCSAWKLSSKIKEDFKVFEDAELL